MDNLNKATFNCNGLLNGKTQYNILDFVNTCHINILFLQETYLYSKQQINKINKSLQCSCSYWSFGEINSKGVGILLFDSNIKVLRHEFDLHGRFLCVDIKYFTHTMRLINVFSPNITVERKHFISNLDKYLCQPNIILGGDFNCIMEPSIDKIGGNPLSGTAGSKEIRFLCTDFHLKDGYRTLFPSGRATTWHARGRTISSRLDRIYISNTLTSYLSDMAVFPTPVSDHDFVIMTFDNFCPLERGPGYWNFNNSLLEDKTFCNKFRDFLKTALENVIISTEFWQ